MFKMIDLLNETPRFSYDFSLVAALAVEAAAYDGDGDALGVAEAVVDAMLDNLFAFVPTLVVPGDVFVALVDELARVLEVQ